MLKVVDWMVGKSTNLRLLGTVAEDAVGSGGKYGWICLDADRLGGEIFPRLKAQKLTRWSGAKAVSTL